MGNLLFIRVSAVTYDEKDVPKAWPNLYELAWPDAGKTGYSSSTGPVGTALGAKGRGVLDLVDRLIDFAQFGDVPEQAKTILADLGQQLADLRKKLDAALGDRNVPEAHTLTNSIEDALETAEGLVKKL